jgi:hypothetical protein
MVPLAASAARTDTIEGELVGISFALHGHTYPKEMMEAHLSFESDFVLFIKHHEHYVLANLPRDVKVRHVGETIRVTGELNPAKTAITAHKLEVKEGNAYKLIWSKEIEQKMWEKRQAEWYAPSG